MSDSKFFISKTAVHNLKLAAARKGSEVSSSHLSEAVAAALGFRTNAALRASLKGKSTVEVLKPSNARLTERLLQFGYSNENSFPMVPELTRSYTPFKQFPLRKRRGPRWWAWRSLMIAAVNSGLEQRLFGMSPAEDWWAVGKPACEQGLPHMYHFSIDEDLRAVASVNAISSDELSISVLVNPKKPAEMPQWHFDLSSADATAHGWIERRLGAWIQDGGEAFHCKRALLPRLAALKTEPLGYADQGSFIL